VVVVDEFSMLRQMEVYYLHRQLQATSCIHDRPFGGLIVLFLGGLQDRISEGEATMEDHERLKCQSIGTRRSNR
jgi:hypothetical protein